MSKMLLGHLLFLLMVITNSCQAQEINEPLKYLGEPPPGITPKIFAPGLISKQETSEFGSVFSRSGDDFFYAIDLEGRSEVWSCRLENKEWSKPGQVLSHPVYSFNDPFLSTDKQSLYFISDMPLDKNGDKKDIDIWFVTREDTGWSSPVNAGPMINSDREEYYMSFTSNGTMYLSSNVEAEEDRLNDFDIYSSALKNGSYQAKIKLSASINTVRYEADVFVAPDKSYLIFCANRNEGLGRGDLYISFQDGQGDWTQSKNMGEGINSGNHELCPFVTADGKYLFYTSNQDIYWVSAQVIERFR